MRARYFVAIAALLALLGWARAELVSITPNAVTSSAVNAACGGGIGNVPLMASGGAPSCSTNGAFNAFNEAWFSGPIMGQTNGTNNPTLGGTCTTTAIVGHSHIAGQFQASAACAAGTYTMTFGTAANSGYQCDAQDMTTPADTVKQTATTTTVVTFTATTALNDLIVWKCMGF